VTGLDAGLPVELREDFREILRLVRPGSRVLDVGCGEGALLELLQKEKGVDGRGIEISASGVAACLARGLSVMQGDADRDLAEFPAQAFDYAILSQTLQTVKNPRAVLSSLMRLADRAIVSFPNFGHWRVRMSLLIGGRMPETRALSEPWWSTPNIHLCTLRDFLDLAASLDLRIESASVLSDGRPARTIDPARQLENWRAESALFLLSRTTPRPVAPPPVAPAPPPVQAKAASSKAAAPKTGDLFD
jgi:methionine biosynthesis protein MetW